METPESLTTRNETNVEKKPKEEKVLQDELHNILEEYKNALTCIGFEKDKWYRYNTMVTLVMFALLTLSLALIVCLAVYVTHILFLIIQKEMSISKVLNKEL